MEWKIADLEPTARIVDTLSKHPGAQAVQAALIAAGGTPYIVGGAVRDAFLGKDPKDIDFMVAGLEPELVEQALASTGGTVKFTGKSFGVYWVNFGNEQVEVALPRLDKSIGEGHTDFEVTADPYMAPEDDLYRRDFTGNAMAYDTSTGQLLDPLGGQYDLANGTLRMTSPAAFEEDPLRVVRALVAKARHGLQPDPETYAALEENAAGIRHLPGKRIGDEMLKLLTSDNPSEALELAHESGILYYLLPEVDLCFGFDQRNPHHELDVGQHIFKVFKHMCELTKDPDLRLAALLHDIGKPDSFWQDEKGEGHFYEHPDQPGSANHHELGADSAEQILTRWQFPSARVNRIRALIYHHMFPTFRSINGARKFLRRLDGDKELARDLLLLRKADKMGHSHNATSDDDIDLMLRLVDEAVKQRHPVHKRDLAISGHDLMDLGIPEGPEIGRLIEELTDLVVDDPDLNNKQDLLEAAQNLRRHEYRRD